MGTEPSRNPTNLSEADARFRYVLADPAARGQFREGMAIAEGIYRPLVQKLEPKAIGKAEATAIIAALIGIGRPGYEAKAIADSLVPTGALGIPLYEIGEAVQSLLSVIVDREEHTTEEVVEAARGGLRNGSFDEAAWWEGRLGPLVDDLTNELFPEDEDSSDDLLDPEHARADGLPVD